MDRKGEILRNIQCPERTTQRDHVLTKSLLKQCVKCFRIICYNLLSYLQQHDDDLRRRHLRLAHLDTTTENDEFVVIVIMGPFREHYVKFCGNEQRQKSKLPVLVAVHAYGGCRPVVHQSSDRWHLGFAFVFVWT